MIVNWHIRCTPYYSQQYYWHMNGWMSHWKSVSIQKRVQPVLPAVLITPSALRLFFFLLFLTGKKIDLSDFYLFTSDGQTTRASFSPVINSVLAELSDYQSTPRTSNGERHVLYPRHFVSPHQSLLKRSELGLPAAFLISRFSLLSALSPARPSHFTNPDEVKKATEYAAVHMN